MSRQLDAAIAEALGWKRCEGLWQSPKKELEITWPEYSADGNAMLALDREMRERGWQIDVLYCSNNVCPGVTSFSCSYSRKNKYGKREFVHSGRVDNEPLARALAAYKALTGKEWEGEGE